MKINMDHYESLVHLWNYFEGNEEFIRDLSMKMRGFRLGLGAVGISVLEFKLEGKIYLVICKFRNKEIYRFEVK